jgi:hypothetical protein
VGSPLTLAPLGMERKGRSLEGTAICSARSYPQRRDALVAWVYCDRLSEHEPSAEGLIEGQGKDGCVHRNYAGIPGHQPLRLRPNLDRRLMDYVP